MKKAHHNKNNYVKDCFYMGEAEFGEFNNTKKTLGQIESISTMEEVQKEDELSVEDIRNITVKLPGCSKYSAEDIGEWLVCDYSDPGFQIFSDDDTSFKVGIFFFEEEMKMCYSCFRTIN